MYTSFGVFQVLLKHQSKILVCGFEDPTKTVKLLHLIYNAVVRVNLQVGTFKSSVDCPRATMFTCRRVHEFGVVCGHVSKYYMW